LGSQARRSHLGDLTIRDLATLDELEECLALQRLTWGEDFQELVAPTLLMVAQKIGGVVAGAFGDSTDLVGFVFGLTGVRAGVLSHWSHMLAVRDDLRDQGIGRQLKLYQRQRLRDLGVRHIFWTFDPLVARNAHLNLNRLGARVVEYVPDMYGRRLSRLDSTIGSDRFVVQWEISGAPADNETRPPSSGPVVSASDLDAPARALPDAAEVRVEIPEDIQSLKVSTPDRAVAWRDVTRRALVHYLQNGYAVRQLDRDRAAARCFYVLDRRPRR
jgi:predicted GNAT superfamily acetyltransferase